MHLESIRARQVEFGGDAVFVLIAFTNDGAAEFPVPDGFLFLLDEQRVAYTVIILWLLFFCYLIGFYTRLMVWRADRCFKFTRQQLCCFMPNKAE